MELNGAVALVTGGSRGIGPHIVRALVAAGARVALCARSADALEQVIEPLRVGDAELLAVAGDVTRAEDRARIVARCEDRLGPVDLLVNNAGIGTTRVYHTLGDDEIARVLDVNLRAPLLLTRLVLPGMVARGRGHIVNVASLAGKVYPPYRESYVASKAGLIGFTRALRLQYRGSGVSASVVSPGFVREAGMHAERGAADRGRVRVNTSSPREVATAVIRAVGDDVAEIVVAPRSARLLTTLLAPFPMLAERVLERLGVVAMYRGGAEAEARAR